MDWIKRNLFFVIGALVAVLLMIGAGVFTWMGWSQNSAAGEELTAQNEKLKGLVNANPNPGSGKVNNILAAREQYTNVTAAIQKVARRFSPIPAIPAEGPVTAETFASGLAAAVHRMSQEATNAGVIVPTKYQYSFTQQSAAVRFAGSLSPLAVQLGEVAAIMDVLIAAKINSLESIQRERVTPDDQQGPAGDYLDRTSQTNELAVISPYQVTFRSFTPELALVLTGFANSTRGILVKEVNVEPAVDAFDPNQVAAAPGPGPVYIQQPLPGPTGGIRKGESGEGDARRAFMDRYGVGPGGRGGPGGRYGPQPAPPPPVYAPPPGIVPGATPAGGPRTVLDEKQLRVTLLLDVVKLLPPKS